MTGKVFLENFGKVYSDKNKKPYAFKISYGLLLLGESTADIQHRVIGMGITPDTMIGIRICEDNIFYLRELDSQIVFECEKTNLAEYCENNWAGNIFHLLSRLTKNTDISGAEILFHKDCEGIDFGSYSAATAVAFSNVFNHIPSAELLNLILQNNVRFADNAKELISIESETNMCMLITNETPEYIPMPLSNYKIIIAFTEEKPFNTPAFNKNNNFANTVDITEYHNSAFPINESKRITAAVNALKKGDIVSFGTAVKQSSYEYLSIVGKRAANVSLLFEIAAKMSLICGVYKNVGIFAFVPDDKVDSFVDITGNLYEKKAGSKPEFYICACSGTGSITCS